MSRPKSRRRSLASKWPYRHLKKPSGIYSFYSGTIHLDFPERTHNGRGYQLHCPFCRQKVNLRHGVKTYCRCSGWVVYGTLYFQWRKDEERGMVVGGPRGALSLADIDDHGGLSLSKKP